MRRLVSMLFALGFAVALAGCGGGGAHSVLPASSGTTSSGHAILPRSTNVTLFNGELWYGAGAQLFGTPLQTGGTTAELDADYDGIVNPVPVAMTVARDGTLYDLVSSDETSWALQAYFPGTFGSAQPEQTIRGNGYPHQVVLVGDGVDVLSTVRFNTSSATSKLFTYAYGAGNNAQPIRKLNLGANVTDVATDNLDRLYVAHRGGAGIAVYPAAASCSCNPIRTIATGAKSNDAIAVSADGIAYVLSKDPSSGAVTIDAYAPGNNGPAPTRSIGPIPASHGTPMGGITVDSDGKIYVDFKDAGNRNAVDVYAPNADGAAPPLRTIAMPATGGNVTAIAIGPLVRGPITPAGTLYVAGVDEIDLFPVTASGTVSPRQRITGFYSAPQPPSFHNWRSLAGIAAGANGEFAAYEDYRSGLTDYTVSLLVGANGPSGASIIGSTYADDGRGSSIAVAPNAKIGLSIRRLSGYSLQRYSDAATPVKRSDLAVEADSIAFGPDGHLFVRNTGTVTEYADQATLAVVVRTIALPGYGPITVAPDGTLYGDSATIDANNVTTESIYAVAPGATTANRIIGPLSGGFVAGLATDNASELYVALNAAGGASSVIQVYGASGVAPVRTIANPIPAGANGGSSIVGIAVGS